MKTLTTTLILVAIAASSVSQTKFKVTHTDEEWKKILPKNTYLVMRQAGTEKPYSGKYWDFHEKGVYACAACGQELLSSNAKFDSGTGWPSFFQEIKKGQTLDKKDPDGERTEVLCSQCGGHLGHVFTDGPKPTGLRYCMNSPALKFSPAKAKKR